jgi:hypothetical protein
MHNDIPKISLENIIYDSQRWTAFHGGETVNITIGYLTYAEMAKSSKKELAGIDNLTNIGKFEYGYIITEPES